MPCSSSLKTAMLASTAMWFVAAGAPLAAQQSNEGPDANAAAAIEEIIVTARRRDETLQEVPIAVSSISAETLNLLQVQDLIEVSKFSPNVTLEVSRGTNTTLTAFIRGVGQQDPVAGFEAGVGIYIDDVYLNRPQGAVLDIFDVERVEVLRGPQGTLYGRNTIGGAIKYVTKRLSDEPSATLRTQIGNFGQTDFTVKLSAPVADGLKIGVGFATFNRDGFGENVANRPSINQPTINGEPNPRFIPGVDGLENYNKQILAFRGTVEYQPIDDLFIRVTGDYVDDDSDPRQGHRLIESTSGNRVLDNVFNTRAGLSVPTQEFEGGGVSATIEYTLSDNVTLKNILAYREDRSDSPIDFDSLRVASIDVPVIYENDQFSEEFQLLYNYEKFDGIIGFYYLDANASNTFDVLLGTTGDLIGLPGLNAQTFGDVNTQTWAVFADFTYQLTDTIALSYGGRFTSDERNSRILRRTLIGGLSDTFGGAGVPIATTSDFTGSETFEEYNNRASISWTPIEQVTTYFSYSEGFKGGGFDPRGQTTATPDFNQDGDISDDEIFEFLSFEPEEVTTYELGIKGSLAEGRFTYAAAFFLSDYTNVQIPGSVGLDTDGDGISDTFTGITSNAASADINGIELEGTAILASDLTGNDDTLDLAFNFGYLDASFNEFIDALGNDVADQRVFQNTPEFTFGGQLAYSVPVSVAGVDGSITYLNSVAYRSEASQFEIPNELLDQPGFALWDMSLVWNSEDGVYQLGLHVKNLTDKEYIVAGYNFVDGSVETGFTPNLGTEGTLTGFYGNPRTYNFSFQVSF